MNSWNMLFFVVTLTAVQIQLARIYNLLDKRLPQEKHKEAKCNE